MKINKSQKQLTYSFHVACSWNRCYSSDYHSVQTHMSPKSTTIHSTIAKSTNNSTQLTLKPGIARYH